jgi:hypothetical protein
LNRRYDLVGDVHGHATELEYLLLKMGYVEKNKGYSHPERTLIFVGDLIDRGPRQKRVVEIAKHMVEDGAAFALMGNHELNAICYATPMNDEQHSRPHTDKNSKQHEGFLKEFPFGSQSHREAIQFFKQMPLWLEHAEFRVIHACWHEPSMQVLKHELDENNRIVNDQFYVRLGSQENPVFEAVELILKGPEINLPDGYTFRDVHDNERSDARINWWNDGQEIEAMFDIPETNYPPHGELKVHFHEAKRFAYKDNKPLFFGHYWQRNFDKTALSARNAICLDYSVAKNGDLVAVRWNGSSSSDTEWFSVSST